MKNQIQIITVLDEGINGGGEEQVEYTWKLGPRNLMKAIERFPKHLQDMVNCYGNIGCGYSWISVHDVKMDGFDLSDYENETDPLRYQSNDLLPINKTTWCKQYIASVLDGSLQKKRDYLEKIFTYDN